MAAFQGYLDTDYRFYTAFSSFPVELDDAVESVMVRNGQGLHIELPGFLYQPVYTRCPVEETERGMAMEVNERHGVLHLD